MINPSSHDKSTRGMNFNVTVIASSMSGVYTTASKRTSLLIPFMVANRMWAWFGSIAFGPIFILSIPMPSIYFGRQPFPTVFLFIFILHDLVFFLCLFVAVECVHRLLKLFIHLNELRPIRHISFVYIIYEIVEVLSIGFDLLFSHLLNYLLARL